MAVKGDGGVPQTNKQISNILLNNNRQNEET